MDMPRFSRIDAAADTVEIGIKEDVVISSNALSKALWYVFAVEGRPGIWVFEKYCKADQVTQVDQVVVEQKHEKGIKRYILLRRLEKASRLIAGDFSLALPEYPGPITIKLSKTTDITV